MKNNKYKKKIILIDLDGVLNNYNGVYEDNYIPEIKDGAKEFLASLAENFELKIFSSRPALLVNIWLKTNKIASYISGITDRKEPAFCSKPVLFSCHLCGTYWVTCSISAEISWKYCRIFSSA